MRIFSCLFNDQSIVGIQTRDKRFNLTEVLQRHIVPNLFSNIATGTPEGVGAIKAGDTIEAVISNIGTLSNQVVREQ